MATNRSATEGGPVYPHDVTTVDAAFVGRLRTVARLSVWQRRNQGQDPAKIRRETISTTVEAMFKYLPTRARVDAATEILGREVDRLFADND